MLMYSIKDSVSEKYGFPFPAENDKVATRQFGVYMKNLPAGFSSADFSLWCLGKLNETTGDIYTSEKDKDTDKWNKVYPREVELDNGDEE